MANFSHFDNEINSGGITNAPTLAELYTLNKQTNINEHSILYKQFSCKSDLFLILAKTRHMTTAGYKGIIFSLH